LRQIAEHIGCLMCGEAWLRAHLSERELAMAGRIAFQISSSAYRVLETQGRRCAVAYDER